MDIEYLMGIASGIRTWIWSTPGEHDSKIDQHPSIPYILCIPLSHSNTFLLHSISYYYYYYQLLITLAQEPFLEFLVSVSDSAVSPYVFSISYQDLEPTLSPIYMNLVSIEFMKAGIRGITLVILIYLFIRSNSIIFFINNDCSSQYHLGNW